MQGLEYVVAYDPLQMNVRVDDQQSNVWVIRKQNRKGRNDTTPLGTYYIVGDCVYMSPSVLNVISSRLVGLRESEVGDFR